jgi:hypothetical protein
MFSSGLSIVLSVPEHDPYVHKSVTVEGLSTHESSAWINTFIEELREMCVFTKDHDLRRTGSSAKKKHIADL